MPVATWQAYVVNLASADARWRAVLGRLVAAGIPFERIEAVRGRDLPVPYADFDEAWHRRLTGRRPVPAEIGCYLSHVKAIEAFLRTDHAHGLFLEDDAVFTPRLVGTIEAALRRAAAWDVLRLQTVNRDRVIRAVALGGGEFLGVNLTRSKGSAAYMLNRRAAETFLRRLLPMRLAWDIAFDLEYLWGLRAVAVTPYPVVADAEAPTQIQIGIHSCKYGPARYLTVFPFRAAVEAARVTCRSLLLARLLLRPPAGPAADPAAA
ncbi:MAG: glycosyltransferase family 25 protein [Planctomycetaceae bacterium]